MSDSAGGFDPIAVLLSIESKVGKVAGATEELRHTIDSVSSQLHEHVNDESVGFRQIHTTLMKTRVELRALQTSLNEHKEAGQSRHLETQEKITDTSERIGSLEIDAHRRAGAQKVWLGIWGFACMIAGWIVSALFSSSFKPISDFLQGILS